MSDHYYSSSPTSESQPHDVAVHVRGIQLVVRTDSGVFAKKGLDFGSRLLIETADLPAAGTVVDLGCGYGVIAAALGAVYPETTWLLLDVNERAVSLAAHNTRHLGARRTAHVSDGFAAVPDTVADAVLLNPPIRAGKAVIYRLFEAAAAHLGPEGKLWIVIHKKHGAQSAKNKLEELFERVELMERDAGYHIFCASQVCS